MQSPIRRIYRKLRFGPPIVVVSGLPRSGTSMLMKMLEAGGLEVVMDGIRTPDEDNPKGYFEHERVKNLAQEGDKRWLHRARGKAIKVISYLLKDLPPDNNYRVLFVRRDLNEILASQAKMLVRRGEESQTDDARMIEIFENDLWKANYLLEHAPQFEALNLSYRQVLEHPLVEARRIDAFLGGRLNVQRMAGVADPALYRNRAADQAR